MYLQPDMTHALSPETMARLCEEVRNKALNLKTELLLVPNEVRNLAIVTADGNHDFLGYIETGSEEVVWSG